MSEGFAYLVGIERKGIARFMGSDGNATKTLHGAMRFDYRGDAFHAALEQGLLDELKPGERLVLYTSHDRTECEPAYVISEYID